MVDNELDGVLAARRDRVTFAVDLAEVAPADLDGFLNALEVEPFTDEQVERILGRIGLSGGDRFGPTERPARFPNRRTPRKNQGYRLNFEELENRLPPSVCGAALAGPGLEFGMSLATVAAGTTVHLWEARHVMEVQGSADAWENCQGSQWSGNAPGGDAAAGVSWEMLFNEMDGACPAAFELQLAG
jgi:hypothetical protein